MPPREQPGSPEPTGADQIKALLGNPVDISNEVLASSKEEGDFTRLAHGLYREAGIVLAVCSCVCLTTEPDRIAFKRNQAICVGLLVRITKFMTAVAQ